MERGEDKLSLRDVSSGGERKVDVLRDIFPIREDSRNRSGFSTTGHHANKAELQRAVTVFCRGRQCCSSLHDFTGGSDGGYPVGTLAFDANGDFYGTDSRGGDLSKCGGVGWGVVFRITP